MITKLSQLKQDQMYLLCMHIEYVLVHDRISCDHNHLTHESDDCVFFSFSTAYMRTNTTEGVRRRWSFGRSRRLGAEQDPLGAHRDRLGSRGGRTLGHAGQARRGGLGSGLGARPRALRSLAASHHAGQAAAPWPLLRTRRERAGHAPRRLRATRWPHRPRTTPALLAALQGGAELAAPGR